MEHVIDFKDKRKASRQEKFPIVWDVEAAEIAMAVVGIDVKAETKIIVRVTDKKDGNQGYAKQVGPDTFLVKVRVDRPKNGSFSEDAMAAINSSVLHEFRHIAQMQETEGFQAAYAAATKKVGYQANPFEVEARHYGRIAYPEGRTDKDTGPAGPKMGEMVWAIRA